MIALLGVFVNCENRPYPQFKRSHPRTRNSNTVIPVKYTVIPVKYTVIPAKAGTHFSIRKTMER